MEYTTPVFFTLLLTEGWYNRKVNRLGSRALIKKCL
jgi:hypothetical protein